MGHNVSWEIFYTLFLLPVGWVIKKAWGMLVALKESHDNHVEHSRKTYATKEQLKDVEKRSEGAISDLKKDMKDMEDRIISRFDSSTSNLTDLLKQLIAK